MIFDFRGERQRVAHQMSDALVFGWPAMPATLASIPLKVQVFYSPHPQTAASYQGCKVRLRLRGISYPDSWRQTHMSIVVLLEIQVKPEALDEMKAFIKKILPDTRAYDGCQGLDVYGNLDDTGNLVFYERWDSRQHYEKYLAWRTETEIVNQLGAMLAAPPSIRYFERLDV